jgi:hypothetical protein
VGYDSLLDGSFDWHEIDKDETDPLTENDHQDKPYTNIK